MYGVIYIDLVSLVLFCLFLFYFRVFLLRLLASLAHQHVSDSYFDLSRVPYVLYGVKYVDLVPLGAKHRGAGCRRPPAHTLTWVVRPMLFMVLNILT